MKALGLFAKLGSPPLPSDTPIEDSLDIRAVQAYYGNFADSSWGDWDISFPVATAGVIRVVGHRFQLNIPKNATITSAVLTAYQNQNSTWGSADNRTLGAEQVDNAGTVASFSALSSRYTNRGTTVTWSNSGTINNSQPVPTGDISAIIQQIVNRGSWVSGNYIILWCSHPGSGGHNAQWRGVTSQSEAVRPRLQVDFEYTP